MNRIEMNKQNRFWQNSQRFDFAQIKHNNDEIRMPQGGGTTL